MRYQIIRNVNYLYVFLCICFLYIFTLIMLLVIFTFQEENIRPVKLAIDRPSEKFLAFLDKYYGLSKIIPQNNKFVVFQGFFDDGTYTFFFFKLPRIFKISWHPLFHLETISVTKNQ